MSRFDSDFSAHAAPALLAQHGETVQINYGVVLPDLSVSALLERRPIEEVGPPSGSRPAWEVIATLRTSDLVGVTLSINSTTLRCYRRRHDASPTVLRCVELLAQEGGMVTLRCR